MLNDREIRTFRKTLAREDERLPIIFNALGDPRRCKIFRMFLAHKRLCVSDVARIFKMSMSLASQHLKILEITKLLVREREGRTVYYRANLEDELVRTLKSAVE